MFGFNGDFASKRKVDLRGNSREVSKAQLVEKTRQDRERRQRQRLEIKSATAIQAGYRGWRDRVATRLRVRGEWMAAYGPNGEKLDRECLSAGSGCVPALVRFCRPGNAADLPALAACCRLVLKAPAANGSGLFFFRQAETQESRPAVSRRACRLALCCFRMLQAAWDGLKGELSVPGGGGGHGALLLALIIQACTPAAWSTDGEWARAACLAAVAELERAGLAPALVAMAESALPAPGGAARAAPAAGGAGAAVEEAAAVVVVRCLELGNAGATRAAARALAVPSLWARSPSFRRRAGVIWPRALESFAADVAGLPALLEREAGPGRAYQPGACVLGNLLELGADGLDAAGAAGAQAPALHLASVSQALLLTLPQDAFPKAADRMYGDHSDDDDVDTEMTPADGPGRGARGGARGGAGAGGGGERWPEPPPGLRAQLAAVGDGRLLRSLVHACLPLAAPGGPGPGAAAAGGGGEGAGALCALLHVALTRLPGQRPRVIGALAYSAGLVPRLWRYLRARHLDNDWPAALLPASTPAALPSSSSSASSTPSSSSAVPPWLLPLAVFSPVASYLLETTDDEEFFDEERPFARADVAILVELLRGCLWRVIWSDQAGGHGSTPGPAERELRRQGSQWMGFLIQQLHDRNFRRPIVPGELFHAPGLPVERLMQEVLDKAPRARELLRTCPALVPFKDRVQVFQELVEDDKQRVQGGGAAFGMPFLQHKVTIRRNFLVDDGFVQLDGLGAGLKGMIRINFVNELGAAEAGVDGGGLFKDFLDTLCKTVFDAQYGLFRETSEHQLYPNPGSHLAMDDHLRFFEFLGRVLGKALYEGILLELPFANFFLSKLRGRASTLNDLPSLDLEMHRHLRFLKSYEGNIEDLCLFFVASDNEFGQSGDVELVPGGRDVAVTEENRVRYIALMAHHRLNTQIRAQSAAFVRGLADLIDPEWVRMFNEPELQVLISGSSEERMDLDDLRRFTNYSGGYHADHPVVHMLWEALAEFTPEQQRAFLKFVTSCSRAPLLGFRYLEPKFCIHRSGAAASEAPDSTADVERLPTAATCMNLLKLPPYPEKEVLVSKLAYAISAGAGFDLS